MAIPRDYQANAQTRKRINSLKVTHRKNGTARCEVCGWEPPSLPNYPNSYSVMGLQIHHVLPRRDGGDDSDANLILLCPNHHAVAHCIMPLWRSSRGARVTGITRAHLLTALRLADKHPQGWLKMYKPATNEVNESPDVLWKHPLKGVGF